MSKKKEKQQDVNSEEPVNESESFQNEEDSVDIEVEKTVKSENDINDKFYRLLADFDNFKKRSAAEKDNIYNLAVSDTIANILPAIDNLERALSVADESPLKKGVEMVLNQINTALKSMNIESFGESGDTFDPVIHEAIMHIEDDSYESGAIVDVLQRGYKIKNKIIRCALVKVAN